LLASALEPLDDPLDTSLPVGTTIGAFRIAGLLGKGGMATVYEAYDSSLERSVALKVLPPEFLHDDSFARRFRREARVIARLEHPNIVPIYASGIDDRIPWMSMRLLGAGNLGALLDRSPLPFDRSLQILRCVADALDYAHARGIVHRDIKPTNILLDHGDHVCVADFGLAYIRDFNLSFSRSTSIAGTPHYMAPEQSLGKGIDHRSDIYSLGVLAYEMLTGRLPFTADSPIAIVLKHINERPPSPEELSPALLRAIHKALAKDPAERWTSAGEFVTALETGLVETPASAAWHRAVALTGRWRAAVFLVGISIALAVGIAIVRSERKPPISPDPAPVVAADVMLTPGVGSVISSEAAKPPPREGARQNALAPPAAVAPTPSAAMPSPGAVETPPSTAIKVEEVNAISPPPNTPGATTTSASLTDTTVLSPPLQPQASTPRTPSVDTVTPPTRRRTVNPIYPAVARAAHLSGDVGLRAIVDVDGKVTNVTVVRSVHPLLDDAAKKAVLQYQYMPGLKNGVPQAMTADITVSFRLE
jgi:TonB family protein